MPFTAKLHIQGVAGYQPTQSAEDKSQLLVLFPDGTPGIHSSPDECLHLNFLQFRLRNLAVECPQAHSTIANSDGWATIFIERELVTVDCGKEAEDVVSDLSHLPQLKEALPGDALTALRKFDPALLDPKAKDPRVMGKLLIENGTTGRHEQGIHFADDWYFHNENDARGMSSVTTVTYNDIDHLSINLQKLGSNDSRTIQLLPNEDHTLELWVRNMCDGFPVEKTLGEETQLEEDTDFVLNYSLLEVSPNELRMALGQHLASPRLPVPKTSSHVGNESKKCMGVAA